MAAGGALANAGKSAKGLFTDGAADKAILYIYLTDLSRKSSTQAESETDFETEMKALNSMQKDLLKTIKKSLGGTIKDGLVDLGKGIANTFTPGINSADKIGELDKEHPSFVKFPVQYNPATINLYSVNGKVQSRRGEEGIDKLDVYKFSGKSKLSFDLIFDDCDNMNAFGLNELSNANLTSLANKGMDTLQHGGNTYSVRKKMDAIMSLLSSSATQQVVFYWANMAFRGTITDVGNRFTMFNPQGHPIRGEMHLELTQDKANQDLKYDEQYWDDAFQRVFKEKKAGFEGVSATATGFDKITNNNFISLGI
ncbi:MAG: hypothetical protein K6C96_04120 [Butyrivibrio sp.]|nr:hypothetical protein [Butyrivibrio sp.]